LRRGLHHFTLSPCKRTDEKHAHGAGAVGFLDVNMLFIAVHHGFLCLYERLFLAWEKGYIHFSLEEEEEEQVWNSYTMALFTLRAPDSMDMTRCLSCFGFQVLAVKRRRGNVAQCRWLVENNNASVSQVVLAARLPNPSCPFW
jgi:hypothetical protein